jgi:uncharacterized membrane protein
MEQVIAMILILATITVVICTIWLATLASLETVCLTVIAPISLIIAEKLISKRYRKW